MKNLILFLQDNNGIKLVVSGTSMIPALHPNDEIMVAKKPQYDLGDVVVFYYKNNSLLVHRIVSFSNERYICKGDNSYRLEDIISEQIIGRVEYINGRKTILLSDKTIFLSYLVGKEFNKNRYDIILTKNSEIYKKYIESYQNDLNN
ncbi:MAG: S24/S26 family peptidase [Synergistaceae bacterium]|nr:S24/S26 family peptidase [Synergistaceae bacterium]